MKSDDPERIEIEIPPGSLFVRHARCPAGCDLMDPGVPIFGHPSIHLLYRHAGGEGHIRLDPFYASYENVLQSTIPDGVVVEFFCPGCGVSLQSAGWRCTVCSAPTFVLHLPQGGFVEGCQRKGCFHHRLRVVSGSEAMQQLIEQLESGNYL